MSPHLLSELRRDIFNLGRQAPPGGRRPSPSGTFNGPGAGASTRASGDSDRRCASVPALHVNGQAAGPSSMRRAGADRDGPPRESRPGDARCAPSPRRSSPPPALHRPRPELDIRIARGYRLGERLAEASVILAALWLLAEGLLWVAG